jgi:hypothetical protein
MSNGEPSRTAILQGTLDLMVLQTLDSLGPVHGYTIAARLEQASGGALRPNIGRRHLAKEKQDWDRMVGIMHMLLRGDA